MDQYERAVYNGGGYGIGVEPNARRVEVHSAAGLRPVFETLESCMRVGDTPVEPSCQGRRASFVNVLTSGR